MIVNYSKVAWRNMLRSKLFSVINIIGLALGISVSLIMLMHIRHELSYESCFTDHHLIYRLGSVHWAKTSPRLAAAAKNEITEINTIGRFFLEEPVVIAFNEKQIPTQYNYLVDPAILVIFNFSFIHGSPERALSDPSSIVLTRSVAYKLFKEINPVGKTLMIDDSQEYIITGVIEDIPSNSHLKIETLRSIAGTKVDLHESLTWKAVDTYVRFSSLQAARAASAKLRDFQFRYLNGVFTRQEIESQGDYFELHPISDIHLYSHREKEMESNSDVRYIYIFSFLSALIIAIATINFINLFTAQCLRRVKEIGVRKVIGARRKQLISQFIWETLLLTVAAALLAMVLADIALPFYNNVTGLSLNRVDLFANVNLSILLGSVFMIALLSGIYPSIAITSQQVTASLKNTYSPQGKTAALRRVLVTFQFVISVLVVIITIVVFQQMNYIHKIDLGFNKDQVVTIKLYGALAKKIKEKNEVLKNELVKNHHIKNVSVSTKVIGERFGYESFSLQGGRQEDEIDARFVRTDEGFVPTLGLKLIEGRNFLPGDTTVSYILNEKAANLLKGKEIVGKLAGYDSDDPQGPIVGIVQDFNFASLHNEIEPLVIEYRQVWPNNLLIKVGSMDDPGQTLKFIEKTIASFAPGSLVVFNFLDDRLDILYKNENSMFKIFKTFSILAMAIAGLGLMALSAHTIESRVKEIGIRKVLGATASDILIMFSGDYIKLVVVASLLSIPLAYYLANQWLSVFAYRIGLSWWIFVLPGIMLMVFTVLIVIGQCLRTALTDPVNWLRYE